MNRFNSCFCAVIFLVLHVSIVQAEAEYYSLPKLDGRIDSGSSIIEQTPPGKQILRQEVKSETSPPKIIVPEKSKEKIASTEEKNPKKESIASFDTPKLDKLTPEIKKSNFADSVKFEKYESDLNQLMLQLDNLKNSINEGVTIQLFSAKVQTTKFLFDEFKRKYENKPEGQLESYKILDSIVKNAVFARNYWVRSNQISYNQHKIPDNILQTKFLKISTAIDKLFELNKLNNVLTEE